MWSPILHDTLHGISDRLEKREPPMIVMGLFSLAIMPTILYSGDMLNNHLKFLYH